VICIGEAAAVLAPVKPTREGGTLVVTKIDRLARSVRHLCEIVDRLQAKGVAAKAKAEGKYRGGIPTARAKAVQVFALVDAGKTRGEAAEELGISIRSVFRILRSRKDVEKAAVAPAVTRIRTPLQVSVEERELWDPVS
jgi:DNA invertase Pin-like site-specific DNA recombinase